MPCCCCVMGGSTPLCKNIAFLRISKKDLPVRTSLTVHVCMFITSYLYDWIAAFLNSI